ncbi:MAG: ABC transporter substrate-binding protein, partial [Acidimicrobiia bacterium]
MLHRVASWPSVDVSYGPQENNRRKEGARMKRFRNVVILLFAFALVVAACSDDGGDTETTTTIAGGGETDLAGTTVTLFSSEDGVDEATGIQRALDVFAEANGMTITHTGARDFSDQINAQAAGGNPPDIGMFPQPGKVKDFASQGFILPINDDVISTVTPQWPASVLEVYQLDGTQYALPAKTDLKSIVWYNQQVFADGGYEIPTTIEELLAVGNAMIAAGQTPWCVGIESGPATGWVFTDWMEDMMLRLESPEAYDQWVANELKFSDPRVVAVGQTILDIWNTPGNTYAAGGSIAATAHSADHGQPLVDGTCAMVRQASFFAAFLPEDTTVGEGGQIGTFYFPNVDTSSSPTLTAGNA